MRIRVLMVTYNRTEYTRLALSRLCETVPEYGSITVWDNNSNQEMKDLLRSFEDHPRIDQIIYNPSNERLRGPTRLFWERTPNAEYLSKVDDDCLMPDRWCEKLVEAHEAIPEAGVLGCWRFPAEDFDKDLAARKIKTFGAHRIMRNCWVEGSGYLMKREVVERLGLPGDESFTSYCTRAEAEGFVNGWYFPFLHQEHMDDPRAPHTGMVTEEDFQRLAPLSARTFRIRTREDWIVRLKHSAWSLQACSYDPKHYMGWRSVLRRRINRALGTKYLPRA